MNPVKVFEISFDYPLSAEMVVGLTATVALHHSDPYYVVADFFLNQGTNQRRLLPDIAIQAIKRGQEVIWVHADSQQETQLSSAAGKAIEALGNFEISEGTPS